MKTINKIIISIGIMCCIIVMVFGALFVLKDKLFYNPQTHNKCHEFLMDSDQYSEVEVNVEDIVCRGLKKDSSKYNRKNKSAVILYDGRGETAAHTFYMYDKNDCWDYYEEHDFYIVDYPGYGNSEGAPDNENVLDMAEKTYKVLAKKYEHIYVIGYSLGTGVAAYIADKYNPDKLVLVSPYTNGFDIKNYTVSILPDAWERIMEDDFPSEMYAENIKIPTLILASKVDDIVPYEQSRKLATHFSKCKFITTKNYHHNEMLFKEENLRYIEEFL